MAPRAYGPDGTLYPIGHPLGAAIAELTARTGELRRDRNVYVDAKGRKLEAIGIAAGFERLLVDLREPDDPTGKPGELRHEKLHIAADALVLPTTSVSLLEAWRFLEGKIRIGSEYVDIQGLWSSHLRAALAPPGLGMIPEASIDAISAVKSSFDRFNGLLSRARQTDDDDATHTASLLRAIKQHEIKLVDTEAVSAVASYMEDWLVAAQAWNAAPQIIREVTDEKWVNAGLVEAGPRGSLTQKRWFDTYFSPVVGRANVVAPSASFSEWYLGIQIFPWANSVDEPMWINGAEDLRRLLAVELAVIPTTGTYGPDKRFSGFDGPGTFPVMIGVALQPLPYVTASFGGIRQAEQQTRVVGEEPKEHWRPYFGLAVQGNVPGLVRALSTKSAAELKMEAPAK